MKKIIVATGVLLVAVAALAYLYFSSISVGGKRNDRALAFVPQSAAVLLSFDNDRSFYDIFKGYTLFTRLMGTGKQQQLDVLKQLVTASRNLREQAAGQSVYVSFHPADTVSILFSMAFAPASRTSSFERAVLNNSRLKAKKISIGSKPVIELQTAGTGQNFYIYMERGVVLGSFSKALISESLDPQLPKISKEFIGRVSSSSQQNENSLINLFTDNGALPGFINRFLRDSVARFPLFKDQQGFSNLTMNFRSDALLFNGITSPDTSMMKYSNLFLQQQPVKNEIIRILPINTASFVWYGLSDYTLFHNGLKKLFSSRNQLAKLNSAIAAIAAETGINPERDIRKFWGTEFVTFQLANHERLAAIRVSNGRQLDFFLEPLSETYNGQIRRFNHSSLLYFYFGDALAPFEKPFYLVADNHLLLANNPGALTEFLDLYNAQRLIYDTERFKNFEQLMAEQSNVTVFIHNSNARSVVRTALKPAYSANFEDDTYGLNEVYGLSYQWSSDGNRYLTSLCLGYRKDEEETNGETDVNNAQPAVE